MIESLLDACQFVLEDQGEPQSSYWLASQVMEMKLWRASEADVRDALKKDIEEHGERSRFAFAGNDEFALRSWMDGCRLMMADACEDKRVGHVLCEAREG